MGFFSSTLTLCSIELISRIYPSSSICKDKPSSIPYIYYIWECDMPPPRNSCTLLFTWIQLQYVTFWIPLFFYHLSHILYNIPPYCHCINIWNQHIGSYIFWFQLKNMFYCTFIFKFRWILHAPIKALWTTKSG